MECGHGLKVYTFMLNDLTSRFLSHLWSIWRRVSMFINVLFHKMYWIVFQLICNSGVDGVVALNKG